MEAVYSFKASVDFYCTVWQHSLEDCSSSTKLVGWSCDFNKSRGSFLNPITFWPPVYIRIKMRYTLPLLHVIFVCNHPKISSEEQKLCGPLNGISLLVSIIIMNVSFFFFSDVHSDVQPVFVIKITWIVHSEFMLVDKKVLNQIALCRPERIDQIFVYITLLCMRSWFFSFHGHSFTAKMEQSCQWMLILFMCLITLPTLLSEKCFSRSQKTHLHLATKTPYRYITNKNDSVVHYPGIIFNFVL